MAAISRNKTKIWIVPADTVPSTLVATTTFEPTLRPLAYIAGQIQSYSQSGGETDVESVPVFGGFVDKEKPVSQVELSFDVIPDASVNPDIWEQFIYGTNAAGVYVMSGQATDRAIYIEAREGLLAKSIAYNNCNAVKVDLTHNADDNQTKTISFKFSPTTSAGISNYMSKSVQVTTLPAWTTLTA